MATATIASMRCWTQAKRREQHGSSNSLTSYIPLSSLHPMTPTLLAPLPKLSSPSTPSTPRTTTPPLSSQWNWLALNLENFPSLYSMDMSEVDLVPTLVFSESSQGKCCVEGKILNKRGMMRPHDKDIDYYGKLFHERLNKYKAMSRQIQVIGIDDGVHMIMRPMPGMLGVYNKKMAAKRRGRRARSEIEEIYV